MIVPDEAGSVESKKKPDQTQYYIQIAIEQMFC